MSDASLPALAPPVAPDDWKKVVIAGFIVVGLTLVGSTVWAALARLDGAVIAPGMISIESNRKTIQHLEGGIVQDILVRDGSVVKAGDVLVKLDITRNQASNQLYQKQLAMALALEARLNAQMNSADSVTFPPEVTAMLGDKDVAQAVHDNESEFRSRRDTLLGALNVIAQQQEQARKDIEQTTIQTQTAQDQMVTMDKEVAAVEDLLKKGLVSLTRITTLQRQRIGLQGTLDAAKVANQKAQARLQELAAQSDQLRKEYRQEAAAQIPDVRNNITDLRQKVVVTQDNVSRSEIRAPVDGTVQQLRIFTIGGVIKPGDPILDIVPLSDTLIVRARVATNDVDRFSLGAPVELRLPQFRTYSSQQIDGTVRSISQDAIQDSSEHSDPYYAVEVEVKRDSIPTSISEKLMAGMNVAVIIPTGERTVLQYLLAPVVDRINTSMRER